MIVRFFAILRIALRRVAAQPALTLATALAVTAAVAVVTAIPLYTDTVYNRLLQAELVARRPNNPPFVLMFRYSGSAYGSVSWRDVEPVDAYLRGQSDTVLDLPLRLAVRYAKTGDFAFYASDQNIADGRDALATLSFATQNDFAEHIALVEGRMPVVAPASSGEAVEVLLSERLAHTLQWPVGETVFAFTARSTAGGEIVRVPVRVVGVWRAADRHDPYWFINPTQLIDDSLWTPEDAFAGQVGDQVEDEVTVTLWYLVYDGDAFRPARAEAFLDSMVALQVRVSTLLPETALLLSPAGAALLEYQDTAHWLTVVLFAFTAPVAGVIVAFLGLILRLSAQRQAAETALLRSRGASEGQILGIAALHGGVAGGLGLAVGLPAGAAIAGLISGARGFLRFTPTTQTTGLSPSSFGLGLGVTALALVGMVAYSWAGLTHTIVSYRQSSTRQSAVAWWQRAGLDIVLLLPAIYGTVALRRWVLSGGWEAARLDAAAPLRQNPLLFATPALAGLALALLGLRLAPAFYAGVGLAASRARGIAVLLGARHLARQPREGVAPLLLLALTLGLALFTASLAASLDAHELGQAVRGVGADLRLVETGENTEAELEQEILRRCNLDPDYRCPRDAAGTIHLTDEHYAGYPHWRFIPVGEHLNVPGVGAAVRVGRYALTLPGLRRDNVGVYLGIDRSTFGQAALWRAEYAPQSLGALANALASNPAGVLISRGLAEEIPVQLGDPLRLVITLPEFRRDRAYRDVDLLVIVVGVVDGFPSWLPDQGPLLVGNLETLFRDAGGEYPYEVWLAAGAGANPEAIAAGVRELGHNVQGWDAPTTRVRQAQARPERQGVVGMLSVGFVVAASLTFLAIALHAVFGFRRRSIEMGVLRAIGCSRGQVAALTAWEAGLLFGGGAAGGALTGLVTSCALVPYLLLGTGVGAPLAVSVAWGQVSLLYGLLGLLEFGIVAAVVLVLRRLALFEALKLGEAA